MAKHILGTRRFGGKQYTQGYFSKDKGQAEWYAKRHREKGASCRITKGKTGWYFVWVRK